MSILPTRSINIPDTLAHQQQVKSISGGSGQLKTKDAPNLDGKINFQDLARGSSDESKPPENFVQYKPFLAKVLSAGPSKPNENTSEGSSEVSKVEGAQEAEEAWAFSKYCFLVSAYFKISNQSLGYQIARSVSDNLKQYHRPPVPPGKLQGYFIVWITREWGHLEPGSLTRTDLVILDQSILNRQFEAFLLHGSGGEVLGFPFSLLMEVDVESDTRCDVPSGIEVTQRIFHDLKLEWPNGAWHSPTPHAELEPLETWRLWAYFIGIQEVYGNAPSRGIPNRFCFNMISKELESRIKVSPEKARWWYDCWKVIGWDGRYSGVKVPLSTIEAQGACKT